MASSSLAIRSDDARLLVRQFLNSLLELIDGNLQWNNQEAELFRRTLPTGKPSQGGLCFFVGDGELLAQFTQSLIEVAGFTSQSNRHS